MASAAKHLTAVVDPTPIDPQYQAMQDTIDGLQRDIRGWARRYADLQRDKNAEAAAHEAWPTLLALFKYWRVLTGHTRTKWVTKQCGAAKFWVALPIWEEWGTGNFAAGIAGIAYQPHTNPNRNGRIESYTDWETLCKNSGAMRRYIGRRPSDWVLPDQFKEVPVGPGIIVP